MKTALAAALAVLAAGGAGAQLLPRLPQVPDVGGIAAEVGRAGDRALGLADGVRMSARELLQARDLRLRELVRANPERLEMTELGPAVRGEIVAVDPDPAGLAAAAAAGFRILSDERIEGLELRTVVLEAPPGLALARALRQLARLLPGTELTANHVHMQSGAAVLPAMSAAALAQSGGGAAGAVRVGIIDGGAAAHPALAGPVQQRGFAAGAPRPSAHGTAVASLVAGSGMVRGALPGAPLLVADVYGTDPAGGSATSVARALGWMVEQRARVVAMSLVGPPNPLVRRAVGAAQAKGLYIVAAVGNDGPAAPPAYPASYDNVIAVTGVDGRGRVLIEAGRARRLDYAAPGADMAAAGGRGVVAVRGTSYAVPLVAGRLAAHIGGRGAPIAALDAEAAARNNRAFGRGLVCGPCRTPVPGK
ncbi:MAG: S8 family serine peptidase [Allosphingosinicella sp.]|uniref:S8 family serine peptidase n=1 Tax=Allosphingosinicella sp. TaxID=2823234 RepID=UPI003957EBA3